MKKILILLLLFPLILLSSTSNVSTPDPQTIRIDFRNRLPHMMVAGDNPTGAMVEIMEIVAQNLGLETKWTFRGFNESVEALQSGATDILPRLFLQADREPYVRYLGPVFDEKKTVRFLVRKDSIKPLRSYEDLSQFIISTKIKGTYFDKFDQDESLKKVPSISEYEQIRLFAEGKVDVVAFYDDQPIFDSLKLFGLDNYKIAPYTESSYIEVYYAISKKSPLLSYAPRIQEELDKLKKSGKIDEIYARYEAKAISLTTEEKATVAGKGTLRMCVDPNWMPLERINKNGEYEGITKDYLDLIFSRIGAKYEIIKADSWKECHEFMAKDEVDMLSATTPSEITLKTYIFSEPYIKNDVAFFTRTQTPLVKDFGDIVTEKIEIVDGYAIAANLKTIYPNINIVLLKNIDDGVKKLANGEIYALIDNVLVTSFAIKKLGATNIKLAGRVPLDEPLQIAFSKKHDDLIPIVNKSIALLGEAERTEIFNRWVGIEVEAERIIDYSLLWKVALGSLILLMVGVWWNRKLAKFNAAIKNAHAQIAALLDNSDEGFLSFGADLKVEEQYSKECERIFGRKIAGLDIDELVFADDVYEREKFLKILNAVFSTNDAHTLELYLSLLPKEIGIGSKTLAVKYKALENRRIMMVIDDITLQKELQKNVEVEQKRLRFVVNSFKNRDDLLDSINDLESFLEKLSSLDSFEGAYRTIHTFKGTFSQFDFYHLPKELHGCESELSKLKSDGESHRFLELLEGYVATLKDALSKDMSTLYDVLGEHFFKSADTLTIERGELQAIEEEIKGLEIDAEHRAELLASFTTLRFKPLSSLLSIYPKMVLGLATRLEKEIYPFEIEGGEFKVDPERFSPFIKALVHVFRNAIDHGVETPDERAELDKDEVATISCKATLNNEGIVIEISDDGRGIDTGKIISKAKESGTMIPENPLLLIFEDSFSTKEQISDLSGRGVGLSAMRSELEKLGGKIEIVTETGKGSTFRFIIRG